MSGNSSPRPDRTAARLLLSGHGASPARSVPQAPRRPASRTPSRGTASDRRSGPCPPCAAAPRPMVSAASSHPPGLPMPRRLLRWRQGVRSHRPPGRTPRCAIDDRSAPDDRPRRRRRAAARSPHPGRPAAATLRPAGTGPAPGACPRRPESPTMRSGPRSSTRPRSASTVATTIFSHSRVARRLRRTGPRPTARTSGRSCAPQAGAWPSSTSRNAATRSR